MQRLFIALDFPEKTNDELLELCDLGMKHASWAHSFHLTLRFIGEVDGGTFDDIRGALAELQMPAFSLTLKGIGFFPPRKQPKILWAGVEKNAYFVRRKFRCRESSAHGGILAQKLSISLFKATCSKSVK